MERKELQFVKTHIQRKKEIHILSKKENEFLDLFLNACIYLNYREEEIKKAAFKCTPHFEDYMEYRYFPEIDFIYREPAVYFDKILKKFKRDLKYNKDLESNIKEIVLLNQKI